MPGSADSHHPAPDNAPLPWQGWACELSLAYGWTPSQIAEMTPAQVFSYLAGPAASGRRRMSLADGLAWCQKRRGHKKRWIRRMMEETPHGQ